MITLAHRDLLMLSTAFVVVGVVCFFAGLFNGVTQHPAYKDGGISALASRLPTLLRRTKIGLILDHHWEIEHLLVERNDVRRIVSDQLAQNGELSRQLQALDTEVETSQVKLERVGQELLQCRRQAERIGDERDLARAQTTLVSTATWGLAESWDRLGSVPVSLPYAAWELRDLLQQVGLAPHVTIPEETHASAQLSHAATDPPVPERH